MKALGLAVVLLGAGVVTMPALGFLFAVSAAGALFTIGLVVLLALLVVRVFR